MSRFTQEDLDELYAKLSVRNGDIIFVDGERIDLESIRELRSPSPEQDDVVFVVVTPKPGQSVAGAVHKLTREELRSLLGAVQ